MFHIFLHIQSAKIQLFILKTKHGEVLKSQFKKELFTLNMFSKNKQNKLRQIMEDEMKEEN